MDLFLLVIGVIIGWVVGRFHLTLQLIKNTQHLLNKPLESLLNTSTLESTLLYTTVSEKNVYLYDKKTEEFLCQDVTLEKVLHKAFNLSIIQSVVIVEHDNSSFLVHKGVIVDES